MFSGFYLALVLLLVALIVRGVLVRIPGQGPQRSAGGSTWARCWSIGSLLAPLLIGVALGDLLHGLPINSHQEYTGSFWTLLQPYGIYAGITFLAVCLLHGATFLTLKTTGELRARAGRLARRMAPATALIVIGFVAWTHVIAGKGALWNPVELAVALAVLAAAWLVLAHQEGWAFAITTITMAGCVIAIFTDLYPRVMVSSTSPAFSLTVRNTASGDYTLKVMTVVAIILLPFVLLYQGWTYYVFRRRVSASDFAPAPPAPRMADGTIPEAAAAPVPAGRACRRAAGQHPGRPRRRARGSRRAAAGGSEGAAMARAAERELTAASFAALAGQLRSRVPLGAAGPARRAELHHPAAGRGGRGRGPAGPDGVDGRAGGGGCQRGQSRACRA